MFQQNVTITYVDGTQEQVTLDQWSIGEFANFCSAKGLAFDAQAPGLMAITMLRFQAWAQVHRGQKGNTPSYTAWNTTVASVEGDDAVKVDPTEAGT